MAYTKKQFLADVAKEATALKIRATKKELSKLSFDLLNPNSKYKCIYGQMTGDCTSERACTLIYHCCTRFIKNEWAVNIEEEGMKAIKKYVNGEKIEGVSSADSFRRIDRAEEINHFSSIEAYIQLPDAKNDNLISFLKGENEKLVL